MSASGTFQTGIEFDDNNEGVSNIDATLEEGEREPQRQDSTVSVSTRNSQISNSIFHRGSSSGERLPSSVNLVALRESFLSEAPFISSSNRTFWRRMVDNNNFQILLSASYYIIADCVSETSVVNVEKLHDIDANNTPLIKTMATNISEMYYTIKLRERELLFAKLPEVLSFMVLTALRTSMPKHHRLCLSAKFREILIDWYCELVGGLRFTNCRTNREWLFTDVFDAQIVTTSQLKAGQGGNDHNTTVNNTTNSNNNTANNTMNSAPNSNNNTLGAPATISPTTTEHNTISVSKQTIGLSPLVSKYTSDASLSDLQVKISLSHLSNRTLTSLDATTHHTKSVSPTMRGNASSGLLLPSPAHSVPAGRPRMKKVDYDDVKAVLKKSTANRRKIMSTLNKNQKESTQQLNKSRSELKQHLTNLNKVQTMEMTKAKTNWLNTSSLAASL